MNDPHSREELIRHAEGRQQLYAPHPNPQARPGMCATHSQGLLDEQRRTHELGRQVGLTVGEHEEPRVVGAGLGRCPDCSHDQYRMMQRALHPTDGRPQEERRVRPGSPYHADPDRYGDRRQSVPFDVGLHSLSVQQPPQDMYFEHTDTYTGGTKHPITRALRAMHPTDGLMGQVDYYPPKRSNGVVAIDSLHVEPIHQRKGVGSALMDEVQRMHPDSTINHGDRTDDGEEWWAGYTDGKRVRRGRTAGVVCPECGRHPEDHPKVDRLYHATSPINRRSIAEHGLLLDHDKGDDITPPGVYLAEHPEPLPANSPVPRHHQDTWEVDTRGLKLHPDPYYEPADAQTGNAFYTTHDIEPGRVKLHTEGDIMHPWNEHLHRFAGRLPKILYKGVSARALGEIQQSGGLRPSPMGESGPGVYLTHDHEYAKRYAGMGYGGGAVLHVEHSVQNPLVRNLDDENDPGERKYREMQIWHGSTNRDGELGKALADAGHDAVETTWRGRHEIAVHDPSKLRIVHIEHVDGDGNTKTGALSDEDRVSVAEQAMERGGLAGRTWRVPSLHRDDPSAAEAHKPVHDFVNGVLQANGHPGGVRVSPKDWDLRGAGSGQALYDHAYNKIGLAGEHANDMTLLHEIAHALTGERGHGPAFQQTAHELYSKHLGAEAADTFASLGMSKTASQGIRVFHGTTVNAADQIISGYGQGKRPESHEDLAHRIESDHGLEHDSVWQHPWVQKGWTGKRREQGNADDFFTTLDHETAKQYATAGSADHQVLYHITDNPHFALDPHKVPEDNTFAIQQRTRPGLYVTQHPESWVNGHNYVRPYLAEIHAPKHLVDSERWGNEGFIPGEHLDKVKVHRVIPLDAHVREEYGDHGWIEGHHGTEFDTGNPIPRRTDNVAPFGHDYHYPGPDVRDMSPEQHAQHKERAVQYLRHSGRGFNDEDADYFRHHWAVTAMGQAGPNYDNLTFDHMTGFEYGAHPDIHHHELLFAKHPEHGYLGHVRYETHPDRVEIHELSVHPQYQRRGVASQLMDEMERRHQDTTIDHGMRSPSGTSWAKDFYGHEGPVLNNGREGWTVAPKTRNHEPVTSRFTPSKRVFTGTCGLDHRLWDADGKLRPDVRAYIMQSINTMWTGKYNDWAQWARIYFAGSEASEWTSDTLEGNNDFDILIGVDYAKFRKANPAYLHASNAKITDEMNHGFRPFNTDVMVTVDGTPTGPWDRTTYVNADSYDIRKIKPYAAYDVGADEWAVKPPHLPHWSLDNLPKPIVRALRSADAYAHSVLKLPEPERTQQGAALFDAWHTDRSRAFGPRGEGWYDIANLREKWLDQEGIWHEIVNCKHRANEGLDLAPADWSNTPPGYVAALHDPSDTIHRGIKVDPSMGWNPESVSRIANGTAHVDDIMRHVDKDENAWWHHADHGDLEDAKDYAWVERSEHPQRWVEEGRRDRPMGQVGVVLEAKKPEGWHPDDNLPGGKNYDKARYTGPLMGNSYLPRGQRVHLTGVHYQDGEGDWHRLDAHGHHVTASATTDALDEVGRREHPNVDQYRSGGRGHLPGDESRSVVGFLPLHMLKPLREHAGDWNGPSSQDSVKGIGESLDRGEGLKSPLMVEYNHKHGWGWLGEGNHRLRTLEDKGFKTAPVRVVRSTSEDAYERRKQQGIGAPMKMNDPDKDVWGEDYIPSDIHPYHFLSEATPDAHEAKLDVVRDQIHTVSPELFGQHFLRALHNNPYALHLTHHTPDSIHEQNMTPLLARGGHAGMLVHDHGDGRIEGTGVFNRSGVKGTGLDLLRHAIQHHGVNYVEAYGPHLPKLYEGVGFKTTEQHPFDRSLAHPDWDYDRFGTPDYHMMHLQQQKEAAMNQADLEGVDFNDPAAVAALRAKIDLELLAEHGPEWFARYQLTADENWAAALSQI